VLSNIYLAEKKQRTLRGSHGGFKSMQQPESFLRDPQTRQLLLQFKRQQRAMFEELADIPEGTAWWNPLRELKKDWA
jgi:hypothetical protein